MKLTETVEYNCPKSLFACSWSVKPYPAARSFKNPVSAGRVSFTRAEDIDRKRPAEPSADEPGSMKGFE